MPKTSSKASKKKEPEFKCPYCPAKFVREKTLGVHLCPRKEREISKNEKPVRTGLLIFLKFYERNMGKLSKKMPTWETFRDSPHYDEFVKVGRYVNRINAVNPAQFIDFLVTSTLPLNKWTSPLVYETYLKDLTAKESPDAAVSRNVLLMQQWATENNKNWVDFFREINPSQAVMWIMNGRISPWMIFLCESANDMMDRFSEEQMAIASKYLDPDFWSPKLKAEEEEINRLKKIFKEAGL